MSNDNHHFRFPDLNHLNSPTKSNPFQIQNAVEHTFDQRNHHQPHHASKNHQDQRTEDQVRNDLNFSIEDLLSKISKATADFEQPTKNPNNSHKQQSLSSSFKISNLSASTETNSNQQQFDRFTDKYVPLVETSKKRESQPQKEAFSNNQRFKQTNPQKHNTVKHGFGEMRADQKQQIMNQQSSNWNSIMKSDGNIDLGRQETKQQPIVEWGRSSSRNQPTYTQINSNLEAGYEWGRASSRNQPVYTFKEPQQTPQWGRNSSRNQPKIQSITQETQSQQPAQWGRTSSRNQPKIEPIKDWTSQTPKNTSVNGQFNQWKSSETNQSSKVTVQHQSTKLYEPISEFKIQAPQEWGRLSSRKQPQVPEPKTQEITSFKNIIESNTKQPQQKKTQVITKVPQKQQLCNPFETLVKTETPKQPQSKVQVPINPFGQQQSETPKKREIQTLLNPFQNSGFGRNPHEMNKKQDKSRQIAASIIIEDNPTDCQQIPIEQGQKVNSLFDTRKIREVAASTIMESPQKMKKKKTTTSPFMEITQTNSPDSIKQDSDHHHEVPAIKVHNVQKNETFHPNGPKITIQDFHLGKQLGSGKFGDVYQAVHKATGALYAIKKIFKSTILEYNMVEQFTRELKIHYSLNYPNIIKLYTHFEDEYHVFLVMEYGEGGMLMEKVKNGEKFASVIVQQMLRAVEYIHNKKIAHRDIKPENIVLMFGDTAKMCDFGWSRIFDSDMKKTFCGTLDYVSPEMKDKGEYSLNIDIWSLGVLTFELLCGFAPFKDEITNWKRKGGNMNKAWNWNILYPPEVSSVAESFMRNLLKQNPNERANIRFCLNHLFVRKYNQMNFDQEEDKRFKEIANVLG